MEKNMSVIEMINNLQAVCGEDLLILDINQVVAKATSGHVESTEETCEPVGAYNAMYELDDVEEDAIYSTATSLSDLLGKDLYERIHKSAIEGVMNHNTKIRPIISLKPFKGQLTEIIHDEIADSTASVALFYGTADVMKMFKRVHISNMFGAMEKPLHTFTFRLADKNGVDYKLVVYHIPNSTIRGNTTVEKILPILAEGYLANTRNKDIEHNIFHFAELATAGSHVDPSPMRKSYEINCTDLINFIIDATEAEVNPIPVYIKHPADAHSETKLLRNIVRAFLDGNGLINDTLSKEVGNGVVYEVSRFNELEYIYTVTDIVGTLADYIKLNNVLDQWQKKVFTGDITSDIWAHYHDLDEKHTRYYDGHEVNDDEDFDDDYEDEED